MATWTESIEITDYGLIYRLTTVVTDYSYDDHGVWVDLCNAEMGRYDDQPTDYKVNGKVEYSNLAKFVCEWPRKATDYWF